ncbi:MAG: 16S rRNA (guanine(966)-N(2))-methyltransferase RsmD [Lentisphaeria bacterium]
MRIISGICGGLRLKAPPGLDTRPTADRVKESLFSMLGDLGGQRVLDLFAGSGALGLEALSRGAVAAVWVEQQKRLSPLLEDNWATIRNGLQHAGVAAEGRVLTAEVRQVPRQLAAEAGTFDLIFADPPYHPPAGGYGARELVADAEFARWAGPQALLVLEHADDVVPAWHPLSPWRLLRQRRYGQTVLSFARQDGA